MADALAGWARGGAERDAALARFTEAANDLSDATHALVRLNAAEISAASNQIAALRHRAAGVIYGREGLAFLLALCGTLMAFREAHRRLASVEEKNHVNEERAAELDIFAGRVAHDLKNPLSAILMRCAAAARAPSPEARDEALTRVAHQARRMNEIIDALLEFARSGAHPEPEKRCDVAAVLHEVVAEARPAAAAAQIELVVEPGSAGQVSCDPSVLAVVLSNLVRNAIKYMGEESQGARRITLRGQARGASMRLEVEDTGPGIPPGTEAKVFEPFVRLSNGSTASGIGLGLATVRRLVEAHGGRVGVEASSGGGCRFWFTLPRPLPAG